MKGLESMLKTFIPKCIVYTIFDLTSVLIETMVDLFDYFFIKVYILSFLRPALDLLTQLLYYLEQKKTTISKLPDFPILSNISSIFHNVPPIFLLTDII